MIIRKYKTNDCPEMAGLFYDTVHSVNAKDYSPEQLNAWATGTVDLTVWDKSFLAHHTVVALDETKGNKIIGFGDMAGDGYLDRLYVHKDYQHQGVATAICDELERSVDADTITTHASITARPFFEKRGYHSITEQQVERFGVLLTNYVMEKAL